MKDLHFKVSLQYNPDNMSQENFYITTTLPYLNSDPHIGFALEIIQADVIARFKKLQGAHVFFTTGTDEHGAKIYEKALQNNKTAQEYVDAYVLKFKALKESLNLSYTNFIRTTDQNHIAAAQEFWKRCNEKGDIYKAEYETKYCVGCELEKHDTELENGKCSIHPNLEIQIIKEENYFFRQSKYQEALLNLYTANPEFVVPETRFNEIKSFVQSGLRDFSISRRKDKMPWGIPVPGDEDHVMYVWFDALVNYVSVLDWPQQGEGSNFDTFWPGTQVAGKDNLRQQSAMWQSMLMSAGLPTSKQIFIHGFINSNGQKMSKSLGNVVDPQDIVNDFGADALRYFLLHQMPAYEDGDFTMDRFQDSYNTGLANGIGNLTSRILKMAVSYEVSFDGATGDNPSKTEVFEKIQAPLEKFNFFEAIDIVWKKIGELDVFIQEQAPFKKIKVDKDGAHADIRFLLAELYKIAYALQVFLPATAAKIMDLLETKTFPVEPLFLRK